jgi:predicted esterase
MHGAGGDGAGIVRRFAREAEAHGIVLLGLKSKAPSWDLIGARTPQPAEASRIDRRSLAFRIDPPRIDAALRALFARVPIDPAQIGLAGFSDGASYALSIGTANPRLFGSVLAFSPGMAELPGRLRSGQRLFVAHGRSDRILSYQVTTDHILPRLRKARLAVAFRPFDGGHVIPDEVSAEAFRFFLDRPGAGDLGQAAAR